MMIPYYNTHKNSAYFHNLCYFIFINTFIISKRCVAIESTIKRRQFPQKTFSTSIDDTHRRINSLNFEKSAIGNQIFSSAKSFGQRIPPKVDSGYFRRKKKKKNTAIDVVASAKSEVGRCECFHISSKEYMSLVTKSTLASTTNLNFLFSSALKQLNARFNVIISAFYTFRLI